MFTRYQICRYLNCMHNLIIYVGFSLPVDRVVSWSLLFTLQFPPCIMCVQYCGEYHDTRGGILWIPWGEKSSLSSLQWTPWALYGASYMYGTHLNNHHHNSKSIGIMWGFVWDPFKRCFGQLLLCRHCNRPLGYHMGPTCTSVFGQLPHRHRYSRPCGYCVELHMRSARTSVWGSFHTIVTRSDPSGIMRLHMGPTQKIFFWQLLYYPYSSGSSGIVWVPTLVQVITNGQLPRPT